MTQQKTYPVTRDRILQLIPAVPGWRTVEALLDEDGGGQTEEWPIACFALVERWWWESPDQQSVWRAPESPWHEEPGTLWRDRFRVDAPLVKPVQTVDGGSYLWVEDEDHERIILGPGQDAGEGWVVAQVAEAHERLRQQRAARKTA